MAFTTPVFNLLFDWWGVGVPTSNPPTYTAQPGQLYVNSRIVPPLDPGFAGSPYGEIYIRMDFQFYINAGVPMKGSIFAYTDSSPMIWYYKLDWWEIIHSGFANQYWIGRVSQCTSAGAIPDTGR